MKKIKTIEPITPAKKIQTVELITPAKNIVSIPIKSVSASIIVPVESVCDHIPIESMLRNLFPIKKETQPVNLGIDDEPKMIQVGNTLTSSKKDALVALLIEFKEVFAWSYKEMLGIDTNIMQHYIPIDRSSRR